MKYFSTRNNKLSESFKSVLFQGLSKDGGLFLPITMPKIDIKTIRDKSYEEVALNIIEPFIDNEISTNDLYEIIKNTYKNFKHPKVAPLVKIDKNKYILELFYGPTFAFKDYALQLLGNIFSYFMNNHDRKVTIIGATSGDTGSAAIQAFKGKDNINIFILHPHNKISEVQRRQMTTNLEKNVYNIALDGNFDDCQKIVKNLFLDKEIQNKTSLTAINSINWARLIAQIVYYFWAYLQLEETKISFIVPSGNFGNIYSARIAQQMGLPIKNLHIVTNQNDVLHKIISAGNITRKEVQETYSPSMDIQISSNFERQIFECLNYDSDELNKIMNTLSQDKDYTFNSNIVSNFQHIYGSSAVSNQETLDTIREFNSKYNYLADPHTATGLAVLNKTNFDHSVVSLGCAHPSKFGNAIKKALGSEIPLPEDIKKIFAKKENIHILKNNTQDIKDFILKNI